MVIPIIFVTSFISIIFSFGLLSILLKIRKSKEVLLDLKDNDAILITGCDTGIGLELAKYFYKTLKCKIICGFLNLKNQSKGRTELLELEQSENNHDDRIIYTQLDLTSEEDIASLKIEIDRLKEDKNINLFALINNAGVLIYGEFDWFTWNQIECQIDVNLKGTIRLTRAILPYIIETKGRIINVSSINDLTVLPGISVYSATKSALTTFTRGIRYELKKFGVNVITMRLGDFAALTNIMERHKVNQRAMWDGMDPRKRDMYKDYFEDFNRGVMRNYGLSSPKDFGDSNLFQDFTRALLSKKPPSVITSAPLVLKIFYFVIELLPRQLEHLFIDYTFTYWFGLSTPVVSVDTSHD